MALVREVDKLDDVPEYARAGYKQVGEKWVNEDIEDVSNLKSTAAARKQERDDLDKLFKPFKALGLTADQVSEIVKKAKAGAGDPGDEDFEKKVAKRVQEALDKVQPDLDRVKTLEAENRELKLDNELRKDAIAAGVLPEEVDEQIYLLVHGKKPRFDLDKKGRPVVLDDDGDATAQTPKEWFEKVLKKAKPRVFAGTGGGGSGARGSDGGSGATKDLMSLPPAERLTAARAQGVK